MQSFMLVSTNQMKYKIIFRFIQFTLCIAVLFSTASCYPSNDQTLSAEDIKEYRELVQLQIKELELKRQKLNAETDKYSDLVEQAYSEYKCECSGTCSTSSNTGLGEECERKELKYHKATQEYLANKANNELLVANLEIEIGKLRTKLNTSIVQSQSAEKSESAPLKQQ
jgi:hypothetical protein